MRKPSECLTLRDGPSEGSRLLPPSPIPHPPSLIPHPPFRRGACSDSLEMPEHNDSGRSTPDNGHERPRAERMGATEQTSGTDRRDALAGLAASEARYRLAVDAAQLGT